ncbi:MAG TPA: HAD family phosphatase [Acidimicrobiales bacterium]|nr:HAD family phosphatase [Acidimicrobiales bacterium]
MTPAAGGPSSPRLLLCDLGGVLVSFSWDRAIERWSQASGVPAALISSRFDPHDDAGREFEVGRLSEAQYFDYLRRHCRLPLGDAELAQGWNEIFIEGSKSTRSVLGEVARAGHRVVGASNTNATHEPYWRARFAEFVCVLGTVYCSSDLGARKPDAEFFNRVLAAEGATARDAVLLDDTPANVVGAKKAGLTAFVYQSAAQMARVLRQCRLLEPA